ncbi:MAG TPA: hypothetical protein VKC51_00725, partial [Lacunisphaera sp.]|nr:hypothetical protein [Lacunisphaera sp.]
SATLKLQELRQQLTPRHLTSNQRQRLVELLKTGPKGTALLTCPMNNSEASDFLTEIGAALKEADWKVAPDIPRIFETTPVGLEFSIPRNDTSQPAVESLDAAFEAVGLTISNRGVLPGLGTDVRILVGANPKSIK